MRRLNITSIIIILAAMVFVASCNKEENADIHGALRDMTFHATIEESGTKTTLGDSDSDVSRKILWVPGDSIGVVTTSTIDKLVYNGIDSLQQVDFTGTVTTGATYYGVYPFSTSAQFSSQTFTISLPSVQTFADNNIDSGFFPMVAYSNTPELHFKNLCGALCLKLKGSVTVSSIIFQGKDSNGNLMKVAGAATVPMNYAEVPAITMSDDATTSVTIDCGSGVTLDPSTAKRFFIVLPPATYNTFSLTITTTDGRMMLKDGTTPLTIARATGKFTGELQFAETEEIDLSASGTANCYIVPSAGAYKLNAKIIGNGPEGLLPNISQDLKKFHATSTDISPLSAQLLWQDVDGLISNVSLDASGILHFTASSSKGNAVVAVYDDIDPTSPSASILWSWHIWCTDTPSDEGYKNWVEREFTLMDRNLGATAALPGDNVEATYGVHYQWGRKDPFSRNTTLNLPPVNTPADDQSIAHTITNPSTFYSATAASNYDWYYGLGSDVDKRNNYLWGNPEGFNTAYTATKSIYDPCPPGYMVAPKDTWTGFTSTGGYTSTSSQFNVSESFSNGWMFYNSAHGSGSTTWYPVAGYRDSDDGSLDDSDSYGFYSSSSPNSSSSRSSGNLYFHSDGVNPLSNSARASGRSVRCLHSETYTATTSAPTVASSDAASITASSATIGGEVTSIGQTQITERGILWSDNIDPATLTANKVTVTIPATSNGKGTFSADITGLAPATTYYYVTYAINAAGTGYSGLKSFTTSTPTDLSASGTANCYIVPNAGSYSFTATVIGNGSAGLLPAYTQDQKKFHTENVNITPVSAAILWQDVADLITDVSYYDGKVSFIASSSKGNAVIAVYSGANCTGDILWSWHIWCTDQPADENYVNYSGSTFTLLDRNLGATAALPGSDVAATYGLHYQWGRKDPFSRTASQLTIEATSSDKGTISNTISHPTYYYYNSSDPCDWHYAERNNYLWGNPQGYSTPYTAAKSIYDPCPSGYMVAPKDAWTSFTTNGGNTYTSSQFNVSGTFSNGWTFYNSAQGSGTTSWYPAAGYRSYNGGSLSGSGSNGGYWSSSPYSSGSNYAGYLFFYSGIVRPLNSNYRANGFSVRCLRVL